MHLQGIFKALSYAMVLLLAAVIVPGCASLRPASTPGMALMWPEPPETTRIKFVGVLRSKRDLGRTAEEAVKEALLGPLQLPEALQQPMGLAVSPDGQRLYVSDYAKPDVLIFDFAARTVKPLWRGTLSGFQAPMGLAVDRQERVYVVDSTARNIRVFAPDGTVERVITHEQLERPTGIAVDDARGRMYVADSSSTKSTNHVIRIFDMAGTYLRALGSQGSETGQFLFPTYLALDADGNLYVTDTLNARVQVFDPDGRHLKTFGERGDAYGMFDKPKGVALDGFGNVYVVDSSWSNVQIFNPQGQVLLFFGGRGAYPGLLSNPTGIAIDRHNRIYVADAFNGRVCMYDLVNTTAEDSRAAAGAAPPAGQPMPAPSSASPAADAPAAPEAAHAATGDI